MMMTTILLIDDDPDEFEIFKKALEKLPSDFLCRYASDTEQALRMLADSVPDFIFSDYNMPKENGLALLSRIRQMNLSRVPFVLYSTSIDKELRERAYALGASYCLKKPVNLSLLSERLKQILNPG
jgi:CheY-like chemotaxis protein